MWPEGSSSLPPECPVGTEDADANGVEDGDEAWSGTCGHDGSCLRPAGSSCQTADVCVSGFCADHICCDRACDGACDHCDLDGLAGTCTGCGDGYACAGTDVCLLSAGRVCQAAQDCASGTCAESGVCCGDSVAACWVSLDVGFFHGCAVSGDGLARCWGGDTYGQLGNGERTGDHPLPVRAGFGLLDFAGNCSDAAQCATGFCIDPFATDAWTCWFDGARCAAAFVDPASGDWYGDGRYESDQLFVAVSYRPDLAGDACYTGWQPGTTTGCTSPGASVPSVDLVIDDTGCSLLDASSRDVLATGGWR